MMHSDNKGLVLPPNLAPVQVVIIPIIFEKTKEKVLKKAKELKAMLKEFETMLDDRDEYSSGWKFNEWELKGVPVRIEIGPKDIEKKQAVLARRDTGKKEFVRISELKTRVRKTLDDIHKDLYSRAEKFLKSSIVKAEEWKSFEENIKKRKLVLAPFCGEVECEDWIKEKTGGATSRCIPFDTKAPKNKILKE